MAILGISLKNNKEQQELVRLINENNRPIVICIGNAGTGKTFTTIAAALQLKQEKKYKNIVYARNPIPMGYDMGSLPGGLDEKYSPYLAPLYDNLESIARVSEDKLNVNDMAAKIEVEPIAFLRGRSFENTVLIIDEAQNLSLTELKTILTRVGDYSKVILLGSMNQIDDWRQRKQDKCDFQKVIDKISDLPYVGFVELTKSMRSDWCVELDNLLGEIDKPVKYTLTFGDGENEGSMEVTNDELYKYCKH